MKFKGSVMSLGSSCAVAAILSNFGIRESGVLDWVRNERGITAVADVFSGALTKSLERGSWDYTTWRKPNKDLIDVTVTVPHWNGLKFINHTDEELSNPLMIDRVNKIREFASQGGLFVYLPRKTEIMSDKDMFFLRCIFEESGLKLEDQLLVLSDWCYYEYFTRDEEYKRKCMEIFKKEFESYFGFFPPKREDYKPLFK